MTQVSISEAKVRFAKLVSNAENGETIIVTRHGKPVAEIRPLPETSTVHFGDLVGRGIEFDEDLSLPEDMIRGGA